MTDPVTLDVIPLEDPVDVRVVPIELDPPADEVAVVVLDDAPPATGGGASYLDDLRDVNAPPGSAGVLARGPDGVVIPISLDTVRTDVFAGDGPPPDVVEGAAYGDLYLDRITGELYRLT